MLTLILGGARSGKSAYAEKLALQSGTAVSILATAQALDAEMQARIAHHQSRRPPAWRLVEEPLALAATLQALDVANSLILVDCLTLWLTNLLYSMPQAEHGPVSTPPRFLQERAALLSCLPQLQADVILVSQIITQRNCHKENALALIELAKKQGWRTRVAMLLGGPRIDHKLALELGYDAGFGPGTKPSDVAAFLIDWICGDREKRGGADARSLGGADADEGAGGDEEGA